MAKSSQDESRELFDQLLNVIDAQQRLIASIADKISQIESIGGGGNSKVIDYTEDTLYQRNTLVVDTNTETVYRVLSEYTSTTVQYDCEHGFLKLVGFESQIVTVPHNPTQAEINAMPDDSLVAVYSATDRAYIPEE